MKKFKLREIGLETVNAVNRTADVADRANKMIERAADQAQDLIDDGQLSPYEYAGDRLQYGMKDITTEAGHILAGTGRGTYRAGKSAIQKYREKRRAEAEKKRQEEQEKEDPDMLEELENAPDLEQTELELPPEMPEDGLIDKEPLAKTRPKVPPKEVALKAGQAKKDCTVKSVKKSDRSIKMSPKSAERAKQSARKAADGAQKTIKTADRSPKAAVKTAKDAAQTAKKVAQTAEKVTEKAVETVKAAAKSLAAAGKAVISGAKSLIATIVAGGWISVTIIVVAMLAALIAVAYYEEFQSEDIHFN